MAITVDTDGTYDIHAGGTYDYDLTLTLNFELFFPASCLSPQMPDCTVLESDGAVCTGSPATTGCTCTNSEVEPQAGSGTWSTSGTTMTIDDGSGPQVTDYCVSGNTMQLQDEDGTITTVSR